MIWLRRRKWFVAAAVLVAGAAIATGVVVSAEGGGPRSPKILHQRTDVNQPRPLRPGQTPGFGRTQLEDEQHSENE